MGDWKLLERYEDGRVHLYNLADDPYEKQDLAGSEKGRFNELAQALRRHLQRGGRVPWQQPSE